jgi:hypothetical protein
MQLLDSKMIKKHTCAKPLSVGYTLIGYLIFLMRSIPAVSHFFIHALAFPKNPTNFM